MFEYKCLTQLKWKSFRFYPAHLDEAHLLSNDMHIWMEKIFAWKQQLSEHVDD